jgi:hypothetical protein
MRLRHAVDFCFFERSAEPSCGCSGALKGADSGALESHIPIVPVVSKGSMQHWPAVYPPEFEIPRFGVVGY